MNHATNKTAIDALTDAAKAALQYHGFTLTSNPPKDAWTHYRVSERLTEALADIAALAPTVQDAEPAQGMPELPVPIAPKGSWWSCGTTEDFFNADQMKAHILADRAERAATQPAGDASLEIPEHWLDKAKWITSGTMANDERGRLAVMLLAIILKRRLAAPTPQAAPTVQGSVDGSHIPTWMERPEHDGDAMRAEIADLRAALAQRAAVAEVASGSLPALPDPASNWFGFPFPNTEYFTKPQMIQAMRDVQLAPTASTPPAPAEKGDCRMTGGICACRSGGSYGGCRKERESCCATAPVAASPLMQVALSEAQQDEKEALTDLRKAVEDGATDAWLLGFVRQYPFAPVPPAASDASVRELLEKIEQLPQDAGFVELDAIRALISKEAM